MATTRFNVIKDDNGTVGYLLPQSNTLYSALLVADTPQSITAPTDFPRYGIVIGVSNGVDLYMSVNGTATVPSGSFALGNTSLNIAQRYVAAGDTISFVTPGDGVVVTVEFYAIR